MYVDCMYSRLTTAVGANNVFCFISVRILKTVTACSKPHPAALLSTESISHGKCLSLQFHYCKHEIMLVKKRTTLGTSCMKPMSDFLLNHDLGVKEEVPC